MVNFYGAFHLTPHKPARQNEKMLILGAVIWTMNLT